MNRKNILSVVVSGMLVSLFSGCMSMGSEDEVSNQLKSKTNKIVLNVDGEDKVINIYTNNSCSVENNFVEINSSAVDNIPYFSRIDTLISERSNGDILIKDTPILNKHEVGDDIQLKYCFVDANTANINFNINISRMKSISTNHSVENIKSNFKTIKDIESEDSEKFGLITLKANAKPLVFTNDVGVISLKWIKE